MQIEIEGRDAREFTEEILAIEGIEGSYEIVEEIEREGTLATIATIIGIVGGTFTIAEQLYKLKRKILDSPEPAKIERVLIVGKNGDRILLKDVSIEQLQKLLDEEKK
ncbi:hypothetical protein V0288_15185 [Pannus brasiliensis CCIBt3594]|uniref:RCK C-terminal domain-containing protein n=1 Tax=Pannus brasiliensis CCIBt3594 TaxID=1427578 RepID=A0AAW9QZ41_9CHRO